MAHEATKTRSKKMPSSASSFFRGFFCFRFRATLGNRRKVPEAFSLPFSAPDYRQRSQIDFPPSGGLTDTWQVCTIVSNRAGENPARGFDNSKDVAGKGEGRG